MIWYYLVHDNLFVSGLDWGTIIYFIDYDFGDNGESGAPVYYKYGTNYYLFGIIVGRKNGGTVVCRASTINNFFGISAYTG